MAKTRISFFSYILRSIIYGDHTRHETTYHMNTTYIPGIIQQQYALPPLSLQQVPRSYSYKQKGDAVRIEHPPPSPSTCRLCVRSFAHAVSPPIERRRHPGAERARRVESIVSALYFNSWAVSSTSVYELPARAR